IKEELVALTGIERVSGQRWPTPVVLSLCVSMSVVTPGSRKWRYRVLTCALLAHFSASAGTAYLGCWRPGRRAVLVKSGGKRSAAPELSFMMTSYGPGRVDGRQRSFTTGALRRRSFARDSSARFAIIGSTGRHP